jgi:hypothetical protein
MTELDALIAAFEAHQREGEAHQRAGDALLARLRATTAAPRATVDYPTDLLPPGEAARLARRSKSTINRNRQEAPTSRSCAWSAIQLGMS